MWPLWKAWRYGMPAVCNRMSKKSMVYKLQQDYNTDLEHQKRLHNPRRYYYQHPGLIGITITPQQVVTARQNAKRFKVEDNVQFEEQNFMKTRFPDRSFDVVWAIESVCYAPEKGDFIKEAYRQLKKGGRLVIADFFFT